MTASARPCYISAVTFVQEGGPVMAKSGKSTASTRATQALARAGIAFETLTYDSDPDAERIGLQAAEIQHF